MSLAIQLLGPPRIERDGIALPAPRGRKVWGLLAYLACRNAAASRAHLAALLFEEAEDPLATLRWNLSELRRLLGDAWQGETRGDTLTLTLAATSSIDIRLVSHGSWPEAMPLPGLGHELLEGLRFAGSPAFEVWLAAERRRLQADTEALLREAAQSRLASGAAREAADLAGRLVRLNPLEENFQTLLVRSLAAAGDGVGAARQAAACRELFLRELGVPPGPALVAAISTHTDAPTARPATGRAAALAQLDAGEAAIGAGALEAGLQCLRRAIVEADATGDPVLRGRSRVALGGALVHAARGHDEEGATALHEALAVGLSAAPAVAAAACRELGYVEFLRGRYERTALWVGRALPLAAGDRGEQARLATLRGAALSDGAHYPEALAALLEAEALADAVGDLKQLAYALSMRGRALLLCGDLPAAAEALERSVALAQRHWTAFLPWPQALRAEVDLQRGEVDAAAERLEHAWALGCQLGDPCWEGIAGRGLGCIALARGEPQRAVEILVDATARSVRLPDAYLWGKAYALDALCGVAVAQRMPGAQAWVGELHALAARSGMRELVARALMHWAALGDRASAAAARLLIADVDNPVLLPLLGAAAPAPRAARLRGAPGADARQAR